MIFCPDMTIYTVLTGILCLPLLACESNGPREVASADKQKALKANEKISDTYPDVQIAGAMKDVMWQGKLHGVIHLDTLAGIDGMYGLGPESYLKGELLLADGKSYLSRVTSDSTMVVEEHSEVSAPFFVYARVSEWNMFTLPENVKHIADLQKVIDDLTKDRKRPFAFKLMGEVKQATIHVQNLPEGTAVSSPAEAHQGQVNYDLQNEAVEIIGFFSTEHQGIFTHHDSYLHMHLITADKQQMGHLDEAMFGKMWLYLPAR